MSSGNSDLFSRGDAETSWPETETAVCDGAGGAAVVGPATAAAYLIGGILVFVAGTAGVGSAFVGVAFIGNSAFVLSRVDFLDGCFFANIGLGGSSIGPLGLLADTEAEAEAWAEADMEMEGALSFAGVFNAVAVTGGVVASLASMAEDESKLDKSSLCEMSCRYSSSSCRLRSSYNPSSKSKSSSCFI